MRASAVAAIVLVLLPIGLSAQRVPMRVGGRHPARPAALPPQPPAIARDLAYKRMRVAVESYPLVTYFDAPGFGGGGVASHWTSFGMGTRADYRLNRFVSVTLDMTSSLFGGPAMVQTAELGTRIHRERSESKAYPFVDVRFGYMNSQSSSFYPSARVLITGTQQPYMNGVQYSQGFGGVAGAGMEYALTRRFSLTTAMSVMRSRMTAYGYPGVRPTTVDSYGLTAYRFTLGVTFNPVRLIHPPDLPSSASY